MSPDEALRVLLQAGLSASCCDTPLLLIQGGRSQFMVDDLRGYSEGFHIAPEPDGSYIARVIPTIGQFVRNRKGELRDLVPWILRMTDENQLLAYILLVERIAASDADWEFVYDRIFSLHMGSIVPLLDKLGLRLEWYDPDTSYEEDVRAYVEALSRLKVNILKVLKVLAAEKGEGGS